MQEGWWVGITFIGMYACMIVAFTYRLHETRQKLLGGEDRIRDMEVKIGELEEYVKNKKLSKKAETDNLLDSK
jgi:hypothetical protein